MKAQIKCFHSPDILDFDSYWPENPESFGFLLQVVIGPEGLVGEESFDIVVCTPKWLLNQYGREAVIIGRHYLIVFEYNRDRIFNRIIKYVDTCIADNWAEITEKLSRLGKWEFEDYTPIKK